MIARRYRITGRVQGVFFRDWTVKAAGTLGLAGWVRNRRDGSVEVLAAGDEQALARLEEDLHEGPPGARVDAVAVSDAEQPPAKAGFTREATA